MNMSRHHSKSDSFKKFLLNDTMLHTKKEQCNDDLLSVHCAMGIFNIP